MSNEPNICRIGTYTVAPELFERGFPEGGGPCRCTAECCQGGVFVDLGERDRILAQKDVVAEYMDDSQSKDHRTWFEENESADPDFPSGRCVGTQIIHDKCAFLDKEGRCTLQVAATERGMGRWALKPIFCVLYPIEVSDGHIGFDDMLQSEEQCCSVQQTFNVPLFRACREELTHLVGEEGYAAMEEHYRKLTAHPIPVEVRGGSR